MTARYKPRSYSETAPVTEERRGGGNALADPGARVGPLTATEQMRTDATAYLVRTGNGDLLETLGLDELGPRGALAVACPTCSRPVGSKCRATAGGGPMNRSHVARTLAADAADHEDQARAELLAGSAGE
jgi:hypothetical protein